MFSFVRGRDSNALIRMSPNPGSCIFKKEGKKGFNDKLYMSQNEHIRPVAAKTFCDNITAVFLVINCPDLPFPAHILGCLGWRGLEPASLQDPTATSSFGMFQIREGLNTFKFAKNGNFVLCNDDSKGYKQSMLY